MTAPDAPEKRKIPRAERSGPARWIECKVCRRDKAPIGRSVPFALGDALCDSDCPGYHQEPLPDCRWPGETTCGIGCAYAD